MEFKKTHVGAYAIIIENKKIALVKKARGGYKGLLDLPGGGIEHVELPVDTLKREVQEEVGATILDYNLFDVTSTNIKWQMEIDKIEDLHHIGILYKATIKETSLKKEADGLDSDGAAWYLIKELKREELTPFAIYSLEKLGYKIS